MKGFINEAAYIANTTKEYVSKCWQGKDGLSKPSLVLFPVSPLFYLKSRLDNVQENKPYKIEVTGLDEPCTTTVIGFDEFFELYKQVTANYEQLGVNVYRDGKPLTEEKIMREAARREGWKPRK